MGYGFPGIYRRPRFFAPSDGPTTVVECSIKISSVVMTVSVTVGVVVIVASKDGLVIVSVDVRVVGTVVVSSIGCVVTTDMAETLEIIVTVICGRVVYPRTSVHHMVNLD